MFNVGDKVRIVDPSFLTIAEDGATGEIVECEEDDYYHVVVLKDVRKRLVHLTLHENQLQLLSDVFAPGKQVELMQSFGGVWHGTRGSIVSETKEGYTKLSHQEMPHYFVRFSEKLSGKYVERALCVPAIFLRPLFGQLRPISVGSQVKLVRPVPTMNGCSLGMVGDVIDIFDGNAMVRWANFNQGSGFNRSEWVVPLRTLELHTQDTRAPAEKLPRICFKDGKWHVKISHEMRVSYVHRAQIFVQEANRK